MSAPITPTELAEVKRLAEKWDSGHGVLVLRAVAEVERLRSAYDKLLTAVHALYYSAHWSTADLDNIDALALWENLRDVAGFEPGHAPHAKVD